MLDVKIKDMSLTLSIVRCSVLVKSGPEQGSGRAESEAGSCGVLLKNPGAGNQSQEERAGEQPKGTGPSD